MKKRRLSPGILVAILFFLVIWISWLRMNSSPAPDGGGPGVQGITETGEAFYPQEIRYGDFEWGSDVVTVSNECNERYVESMTPEWSEAYSVMGLSSYQLGYLVYQYGGHSAGGHYARDFKMFFHYGHSDGSLSLAPEDSELYLIIMSFDVLDYEGTYDVDDSVVGVVRTEGPVISLNGAWAQNIGKNEMFIDFMGDKAGVRLDYGGHFTLYTAEHGALVEYRPDFEIRNMYELEIDSFLDCVRSGKPNRADIHKIIHSSEIMQALYDSSDLGREVVI